ncbi:hypothetical protein BD408DRAFT_413351 [Parasitella parasitica]|nr:hypothetical protein BD408DRAFT_413351 [Parasitella parasitica]
MLVHVRSKRATITRAFRSITVVGTCATFGDSFVFDMFVFTKYNRTFILLHFSFIWVIVITFQ